MLIKYVVIYQNKNNIIKKIKINELYLKYIFIKLDITFFKIYNNYYELLLVLSNAEEPFLSAKYFCGVMWSNE